MDGESQMRAFHSRKQEVYEAVSVVVQTLERIEDLLNQEVIGPSAWHETCSRLPVGYYSVTSLRLRDNEPVLARVARQRRRVVDATAANCKCPSSVSWPA